MFVLEEWDGSENRDRACCMQKIMSSSSLLHASPTFPSTGVEELL